MSCRLEHCVSFENAALDSDDLLYLKEQMEAEEDAERLLRRTEKRAFQAFKISFCLFLGSYLILQVYRLFNGFVCFLGSYLILHVYRLFIGFIGWLEILIDVNWISFTYRTI